MEENFTDNKKSSKEIWLILIFVDIIALCILSYLIYNSFINNGNKTIQIKRDVKTEDVVLEKIDLSEPIKEAEQEPKQEISKEIKTEVKDIAKESKDAKQQVQVKKEEIKKETKAEIKKEKISAANTKQESKESFKISGTGKWRKVTFRYFNDAKSVAIVSGFTSTKPTALKKVKGVWETTLTIAPGTYRYMFIVDGKETKDPYNKQESNGRSVITIK